MTQHHYNRISVSKGFSLIEVVLAIGIFLVTVLALVGLLGPTLQSIDEVEKIDEVSSIVNSVNAFLQSSPNIAMAGEPKFATIYNAVRTNDLATLFVFRAYASSTSENIVLKIGFDSTEPVNNNSKIQNIDFSNASGPIYRVVLSASSVLPETTRSATRITSGVYTLNDDIDGYLEGSFAMEVRIFAEEPPSPSQTFDAKTDLNALNTQETIFTYNTAIVR
jgi:Tfp pilus assembly protein PilV